MMSDDMTLVREFAASQSEPAFVALVERHIGLVHSSALRQTGDIHLAEEITQAVFIILARKASALGPKTILCAWLYRTTRFAAADALKARRRRQLREQEAYMQSTLNQPDADAWTQLAPLLDDAMNQLGETDRAALVLRFFENKNAREIADMLRMKEEAAQKRVARALEKLRGYFSKRGINSSTETIAETISAHSIQAAPVALAKAVTAVALAKGATASISTLTLIHGALKIMAWTKAKTAIVAGAAIILAATTGTVVFKAIENRVAPKLQMRVFKVDPRIFLSNLLQAAKPAGGTAVTNIFPAYLASKGISIQPPKAIAFNDSTGMLFVKATAADLNAIEKVVQQLNYAPAQVHMKTYFIEVPESDVTSVLKAGTVINTTNDNSVEILDDDKFAQLLRLLSPNNSRTLAAPSVVTVAGRQTSMRAGNVSVDLLPTLLDDGYTLKMKIIATAAETLVADANIWDSQTIALGTQKSDGQSRLFVFTSTHLIDPAGNLLHHKNELPFKPGTIPPQ